MEIPPQMSSPDLTWFPAADFEEWASMPNWSSDEFTSLILGRDPWRTNLEAVNYYKSSAFSQRWHKMRSRVWRSCAEGDLDYLRNKPVKCVEWAQSYGVQVPPELTAAVERVHGAIRQVEDLQRDLAVTKQDLARAQARIVELLDRAPTEFDVDPDVDRKAMDKRARDTAGAIIGRLMILKYGPGWFENEAILRTAYNEILAEKPGGAKVDIKTLKTWLTGSTLLGPKTRK